MADKKLLEESTIRRFMQLANIKPTEQGVLSEGLRLKEVDEAGGYAGKDSVAAGQRTSPAGMSKRPGLAEKKKHPKKMEQEDLEENVDEDLEEGMEEEGAYQEMSMHEAEDEGGEADAFEAPEVDGGADMAGEGGDAKADLQNVLDAWSEFIQKHVPELSGQEIEMEDEPEGEDDETGMEASPEGDEAAMEDEAATMMERKVKKDDKKEDKKEDLEESIELVDDALIEKLVQRVSSRLVAEARKSRELAESKSGWGKKGMHANAKKSQKSTHGHGAGSGKKSTPYSSGVKTKGTAGRK